MDNKNTEFCTSILLPGRMTDSLSSETSGFWQLLKADFQSVTKVAFKIEKFMHWSQRW